MGIGDIFWPYEKKFTEVPGAREAGIASLFGGPAIGATSIIVTKKPIYAFRACTYSSFFIFWIAFIYYRTSYMIHKTNQSQFVQAYKTGKID